MKKIISEKVLVYAKDVNCCLREGTKTGVLVPGIETLGFCPQGGERP